MARIFLDTLRSNINSLITQNSNGDISGTDLNGILTDITDSTVRDEASLLNYLNVQTLSLTTDWQPITVFNVTIGETNPFLVFDPVGNDYIQTTSQVGFSYGIFWSAIIEAEVGENVELGISSSVNGTGAANQWGTTVILQGNGTIPVSGFGFMPINANSANDQFGMIARSLDAAADVQFDQILMQLSVYPTNNP